MSESRYFTSFLLPPIAIQSGKNIAIFAPFGTEYENVRKGNKKIATIFLLVLALAPVFYVLAVHTRQYTIRQRMKHELEEKMLHTITLKSSEIHWIREGKEIAIEKKLFDVKSIAYKENGMAVLTGLFDEEETDLVQQLQKNQKENNSQGSKQLAQLFQLMLVMPEFPHENNSLSILLSSTRFPVIESDPVAAFKTIPTPPPQA
jgi:hypothetical protein